MSRNNVTVGCSVYQRLSNASLGMKFLKQILNDKYRKERLSDIQFIIFPESDEELNKYGCMYIDEYILRYPSKYVVVLWHNDEIEKYLEKYVATNVTSIKCNNKDIDDLMAFYVFFNFSWKCKIVSLDKPEGRYGSNLLSTGRIDKELLVGVGIYNLIPFDRKRE